MINNNMNVAFLTDVPLVDRIKFAWAILTKRSWRPILRFTNGVEMDFSKNKIILSNPTHIYSKETLHIQTDKHLILDSGKTQVDLSDPDYRYSVWMNTELDHNNNPILEKPIRLKLFTSNINREIALTDSGTIIVI